MCAHDGVHRHEGRYDRDRKLIRYLALCEDCGAELATVHEIPYEPRPVLHHAAVPTVPGADADLTA
jgi:hypothetical protein